MDLMEFFDRQLSAWPKAAENYRKLKSVRIKDFNFDGFFLRVIYNPARAVSSFAKVDVDSIKKRPCFLCAHNRPQEQFGVDFLGKYQILINPYPICPVHFTVCSNQHSAQEFSSRIDDFLDLAAECSGFTALFNGAKAGASAPDHMHFQLVNSDFFAQAIEKPMKPLIVKETFVSANRNEIKDRLFDIFKRKSEDSCNIFCRYENNNWVVVVFPRKKHRPSYFMTGEILSSPGSIDMTGNLIIAREEDFNKLTKEIISDIYTQISGY